MLVEHKTAVTDFFDKQQLESVYHPEVEQLIKQVTGAARVVVFDSAKDGRVRFTAHTAFDDPGSPAGAPPRQSIEARALAFFAG